MYIPLYGQIELSPRSRPHAAEEGEQSKNPMALETHCDVNLKKYANVMYISVVVSSSDWQCCASVLVSHRVLKPLAWLSTQADGDS